MLTRLTDDTLEAYIAWREERVAVRQAYRRWCAVSVDDAASAFRAYQAALDREEKASWGYAKLLSRLEKCLAANPSDTAAHPETVF